MEIRLEAGGEQYTVEHMTTNLMAGRHDVRVLLHTHPVFHIMYVLEGKGLFTVDGTASPVEPGMLHIIHPNRPHQFHFGMGGPMVNLESTFMLRNSRGEPAEVNLFDVMEEQGDIPIAAQLRTVPITVPARYQPLLEEGYRRLLDLYNYACYKAHFAIGVADLLARLKTIYTSANHAARARLAGTAGAAGAAGGTSLAGAAGPSELAGLAAAGMGHTAEQTVEQARRFLRANRHRPVTLNEVAQAAYVTPNYLCRLFKERTGKSPLGYLQEIRMQDAAHFLTLTDLPIYSIAEKLGYDEPSYFARLFRRAYGQSPHAYRKQQLGSVEGGMDRKEP